MPAPTDHIPWEHVERAFQTNLDALYRFVVSCVIAAEFERATFYARRIQNMEEVKVTLQVIYHQRQMTLAEIQEHTNAMLRYEAEPTTFNGPRPTVWERLMGVSV